VVLTSAASSVCIRPLEGDGHELDEESWSDLEWVAAEKPPSWVRACFEACCQVSVEHGWFMRLISPANVDLQGYVVSKVLSEKEALRFAEEHGLSLAIVCPVLTVGASPVPKVYTSVPASLSMLSGASCCRRCCREN
jgi:anthocyanidin reductase